MIEVKVSPRVFNDVYLPYLDNDARTQIFYGGASSGKSVFLAQRVVWDTMAGGRNYLVCRQVGRTIRRSVFAEIVKVINEWRVRELFDINKSELLITCQNGYQILFAGLDDVQKLKSITPSRGAITDIWVEEATEISKDSVKQLYKRQRGGDEGTPKRLTLSFNPIVQDHWIYNEYFADVAWADDQTEYTDDDLTILKTWYKHNQFLTREDVEDLEGETDKYYREVYTYGNWGVLGNVIFTNWEVRDLSDMRRQFTNHRNGGDFGFANDPAAIVATHYHKRSKTIYIYDEFYERGLTNDALAKEALAIVGYQDIVWDSAEPKSIAELKQYEVRARPAKKGPDSVLHGIQWLQQQTIIIDKSCVNARNEFQQYKWKEDRNGNILRQPVDANNHIIDALRYAYEDDMEFHSLWQKRYA